MQLTERRRVQPILRARLMELIEPTELAQLISSSTLEPKPS